MFKISNSNPSDAQGQVPADLPIHTMKKDLEEIDHPSEFKKNEPEAQEKYILSDTQKSSPFLSSAPQPKQIPTSIKFKDEASEQRIDEDKLARQQAEERRIAEQKAEMARKIAEERNVAEQKEAEQEAMEERKREEDKKIMEERLAKQKAAMAQKMAEENAGRERQMSEQREKEAATSTFIAPAPIKATPPIIADSAKIKILKNNSIESRSKSVISSIVIIILILSIAGGGYYFWITRQQEITTIENNIAETPAIEPVPIETFSTDKPNYLIINQVNPTASEIKTALKKYTDDILQSSITVPIEFVVVDAQNNPISFFTFANTLNIKLSPAVISNLADVFSLFIYNDQGNARLGLAVDSKNDILLKTAMLAEEKTIVAEISPLFMDVAFANPANKSFNKNIYNNTELRYINLISSKPLSIDYGILNNKLLIGTSKETTFAIVDYIKNPATEIDEE